ncbi:MAG: type II toxin-antitoxin system RelE/ParE family toxin [Verrucomicrobia subdivision 3 bacterium]|nr:type II toxin-antitoxin system RelE/ParE family toxin [Limisphaerales bacterium]
MLPSAMDDLAKGREFYERQGEGLGSYFVDTLFSDIDSLLLYAGIHRKIGTYHRAVSKRFPFAIYYRVNKEVIEVWRVLDCRQNPAKVKKALK